MKNTMLGSMMCGFPSYGIGIPPRTCDLFERPNATRGQTPSGSTSEPTIPLDLYTPRSVAIFANMGQERLSHR